MGPSSVAWQVLEKYFDTNPYFVTKHHLDSYNDFVDIMIPKVIQSMNPIQVKKYEKLDKQNHKHMVEVFIGGEEGNRIYFDKPMLSASSDGKNHKLMFPNDARLNDVSYASNLLCDVVIRYYQGETITDTQTFQKVKIGSIPIMLHSKLCVLQNQPAAIRREMGECPFDQGGYFIVDGKEKLIIAQERNITNQVFVNSVNDDKYTYKAMIRCTAEKTSVFPKTIYFRVFNGTYNRGMRKNAIVVEVPQIKLAIPLFVLFRAMGVESDKDIIQHMVPEDGTNESELMIEFLRSSVIDGNIVFTQKHALEYLKQYTAYGTPDHVKYILIKNLFPNIQDETDSVSFSKKALYLGYVCNHLIKVCIGIENETDRDNYMFKRVGTSGFLIGDIFKDFYNKFRNHLRNNLDKMYEQGNMIELAKLPKFVNKENISRLVSSQYISSGLTRSLKGQWGVDKVQEGIVQDVSRVSYMSFISHLRRVSSPMDPSIKIRSPHQLNTSQFGVMCPCESPDGASIGLIKNFAMLAHITFNVPSQMIIEAIKTFDVKFLDQLSRHFPINTTKIMINNNWVGVINTDQAPLFVKYMKLLRRNGLINIFTSISWSITSERINILTDSGRCTRPLFVVNSRTGGLIIEEKHYNLENISNWYQLAKGDSLPEQDFNIYSNTFIDPFELFGLEDFDAVLEKLEANCAPIEFIDVEECNTCMIAMTQKELNAPEKDKIKRYTHCELHPSVMFSVYTSTIPLANHNHAPRNIFSGAQGKQAIGIYATNFTNRIDTMSYILHYPQQRLVKTRYSDLLRVNQMPNGENLVVAICSYTGYNQEDSIIFNKDAIDRGMFNITYYKSYIAEEKDNTNKGVGERIVFANPTTLQSDGKPVKNIQYASYENLDEDGFPRVNSFIQEKDAIVGMCRVKTEKRADLDAIFSDKGANLFEEITGACEIADRTVTGHVDKVYIYERGSGADKRRAVKIRLRKMRTPEPGDKAASAHGQKGVCGLILPRESMPFTKDGIVPDIIINPHAFPSRMTVGHLMECILTKICVMEGCSVDATPFDENDMNSFYDRLEAHGMQRFGDELLYNGMTGEQMSTDIFIGPTYYHRLKHMVADKINYRTTGKRIGMTMQPTKGRSNEGGLRIGEMEANCLISHGIASFAKESFMERSDQDTFYVNNHTGDFVSIDKKRGVYNGVQDYSAVKLPYAFKLLCQELNTMSIKPTLILKEHNIPEEDFEDDDLYVDEEDASSDKEDDKENNQE